MDIQSLMDRKQLKTIPLCTPRSFVLCYGLETKIIFIYTYIESDKQQNDAKIDATLRTHPKRYNGLKVICSSFLNFISAYRSVIL